MGLTKTILLWVMGVFYLGAGANHFWHPDFYVAIMPPILPYPLELVWISGVAEMALGAAVLVPSVRVPAAWGLILLLVAIFPANVHMAIHDIALVTDEAGRTIAQAGAVEDLRNWIRLPFQGVFIAWAWWNTR